MWSKAPYLCSLNFFVLPPSNRQNVLCSKTSWFSQRITVVGFTITSISKLWPICHRSIWILSKDREMQAFAQNQRCYDYSLSLQAAAAHPEKDSLQHVFLSNIKGNYVHSQIKSFLGDTMLRYNLCLQPHIVATFWHSELWNLDPLFDCCSRSTKNSMNKSSSDRFCSTI